MPVQTVQGPINATSLGRTLMHEHIFSLYLDYRADYGFDEEAEQDRAVQKLADLTAAGISTLVDMTVFGLGRNVGRVRSIAERVPGLNIIVATGVYTFADLPGFFRNRAKFLGEDWIGDLFTREVAEGIGETGIRAGAIKLVTDEQGVTDDVALLTRQVARAHLATNAPVITHSHAHSRRGAEQQRLLGELGVAPERIVVGHVGDSDNVGYLEALIEGGSWLGMDRFGFGFAAPLEQRIDVVAQLCAKGYADRMVLSHDANVHSDSVPDEVRADPDLQHWNFRCVSDIVIPALRERGVPQADIDTMMVTNPQRILEV